jgi:hypothetical protein
MSRKKLITALLSASALVTLLAGCSNSSLDDQSFYGDEDTVEVVFKVEQVDAGVGDNTTTMDWGFAKSAQDLERSDQTLVPIDEREVVKKSEVRDAKLVANTGDSGGTIRCRILVGDQEQDSQVVSGDNASVSCTAASYTP